MTLTQVDRGQITVQLFSVVDGQKLIKEAKEKEEQRGRKTNNTIWATG